MWWFGGGGGGVFFLFIYTHVFPYTVAYLSNPVPLTRGNRYTTPSQPCTHVGRDSVEYGLSRSVHTFLSITLLAYLKQD